MATIKSFEDIEAWQLTRKLCKKIQSYGAANNRRWSEHFAWQKYREIKVHG